MLGLTRLQCKPSMSGLGKVDILCTAASMQERLAEVQQEQKVAGQKVEAKNMLIHQSCEKLGLHPATKPTGSMIDSTLYFNWRQQGRGSRSPIAQEKCEALLHGTFKLAQ